MKQEEKDSRRLPIVGVMGSGTPHHPEQSGPLGRWLAQQGVHLLTGGGGGVMTAVSQAFSEVSERKGLVIGIIPSREEGSEALPKEGYPNRWVEVPVYTHLPLSGEQGREPLSRNHINVLSSDVLIALPGGPGTASEVSLAIEYQRPVVAFLRDPSEIPGLDPQVTVEADFEKIKEFVRRNLPGLGDSDKEL